MTNEEEEKAAEQMAQIQVAYQRLAAENQWLWEAIKQHRKEILDDLALGRTSLWLCNLEMPHTLNKILDKNPLRSAGDGFLNGIVIRYIMEHALKDPVEKKPLSDRPS